MLFFSYISYRKNAATILTMKPNYLKKFLLITITVIIAFSCKKENSKPETGQTNFGLAKKVLDWLDVQKENFKGLKAQEIISDLKENIIFSEITTEIINNKQKIVIVPLKNDFQTSNEVNGHSLKNLVIYEFENMGFTTSNIFESIPEDQSMDKLPDNLISNIINNKKCEVNGIFIVLSITNGFMEEREYKNGNLITTKYLSTSENLQNREKNKNNTEGCMDWYWITSGYDANGEFFYNEQYAFTSCDDQCQTTSIFQNPYLDLLI